MQMCVRDGVRQTTASAFLRPIMDDPNLTVLTNARALRLVFDGDRCVGVEISRDGQIELVHAAAEVVVSCGTVESPRLLTLSGLGPSGELRRLGIDVRVDLAGVGENLYDHPLVPVLYSAEKPVPPPALGTWAAQTHLFARSRPGLTAPDLQPIFFSVPLYAEPWMEGPPDGFTLMAGVIRPASRGSIKLRSTNPDDEPLIDPAFLACDADVEAMLIGMELMREIGRTSALAEWGPTEIYPGPTATSREELIDYMRHSVGTYFHPVGTCRMGIDRDAVVDPELRVYGVSGLRVADASIMPTITSGNTAAPSMMIGEKAADLITATTAAG